MHVVDAGYKTAFGWKECLPVCVNLRIDGSGNNSIEIVVGHDFYQMRGAVGKSNTQGQYLMAAMPSSFLRARCAYRKAADHYVVYGAGLICTEKTA